MKNVIYVLIVIVVIVVIWLLKDYIFMTILSLIFLFTGLKEHSNKIK